MTRPREASTIVIAIHMHATCDGHSTTGIRADVYLALFSNHSFFFAALAYGVLPDNAFDLLVLEQACNSQSSREQQIPHRWSSISNS